MTTPARLGGWAPGAKGCSGNQTLKASNGHRRRLHVCIYSFNPPRIFPEGLLSTRHGRRCVTARSCCYSRSRSLSQRPGPREPACRLRRRQPQASESRGRPGTLSAGSPASHFLPRPLGRPQLAAPGQGLWGGLSGGGAEAARGSWGSRTGWGGLRAPALRARPCGRPVGARRGLPHSVAAPGPGPLPGWRGALKLHSSPPPSSMG